MGHSRAAPLRLDPQLRPPRRRGGKLPLFVHAPGLAATCRVNRPCRPDRAVAVLPREGEVAGAGGQDRTGKDKSDRAITEIRPLTRFRVRITPDPALPVWPKRSYPKHQVHAG